ncbi:MAG: hypothetical protein F4X72_14700 [Dehalococcoidia bacterium]|nr:hypothetical protein [Dehalococcoidia bacterium]
MPNLFYAMEKITNSMSTLATSPGRIKERLRSAFLELHLISDDIPASLQADYQWIIQELTKAPDQGQGSVVATLEEMSEDHAVEIAKRIDTLAFQVFERYFRT